MCLRLNLFFPKKTYPIRDVDFNQEGNWALIVSLRDDWSSESIKYKIIDDKNILVKFKNDFYSYYADYDLSSMNTPHNRISLYLNGKEVVNKYFVNHYEINYINDIVKVYHFRAF